MDADSQVLNRLPFVEALRKAVEINWSGQLHAGETGTVFLSGGNVAWAVGKNQVENFSSILEKRGLMSRQRLSELVAKQKAMGKAKRVSELLEEEGSVPREELRECLRKHISAAIAAMMSNPGVEVEVESREVVVDDGFVFPLTELLPGADAAVDVDEGKASSGEGPEEGIGGDAAGRLSIVLGSLASLPGYRFSLISGPDGKLIAFHEADSGVAAEEDVAGANAWVVAAAANAKANNFGVTECIFLEHEKGLLLAQSADGEGACFVIVSIEKNGKLGVFKHKIADLIPSIRNIL